MILYLFHLGFSSPLLAVSSRQRGVSPGTLDLKPRTGSSKIQCSSIRDDPAGLECCLCNLLMPLEIFPADWIPQSVPVPAPLTASVETTVRLLLPWLRSMRFVCAMLPELEFAESLCFYQRNSYLDTVTCIWMRALPSAVNLLSGMQIFLSLARLLALQFML